MWERGPLAFSIWGFVLQTMFYGLYLLLFGLSLYVHQSYRSGKFMVAFALVLFSLLTTHWVLGFFRFYQAYVVHGEVPGGTFAYLGDMGAPTWVAQLAVNALARVLMDALLVARLYVIWNSNLWVIVLPATTLLGDLVASILNCYEATQFAGFASSAFRMQAQWITAAYSFSCCTNIVASSLIIYRIFAKNRVLKEFNLHTSLAPVLLIIVESASIYTIFSVILLVLFKTRSDGVAVVLPFLNPLVGIVCSLITIQVALGLNAFCRGNGMSAPTLRRASAAQARTSTSAPSVATPLDTFKYAASTVGSRSELALAAQP